MRNAHDFLYNVSHGNEISWKMNNSYSSSEVEVLLQIVTFEPYTSDE